MHFLFPDINSLLLVFHPSSIMAIIKLRLSPTRKHFKRKKKILAMTLNFPLRELVHKTNDFKKKIIALWHNYDCSKFKLCYP